MNHQVTFSRRIRSGCLLAAALLAGSTLNAAIPVGNSTVQIGGFLSQGYIQGDGNNYPFDLSDGTVDFRELGLNASTPVGAHLRIGAQLFAQRLGNYGGDRVKLDWAQADYNFRQEFGIRVGRVKYPKGLYGEALDLDVVRPFIFLPMALYNPVVRDFNSALNGGLVYGSVEVGRAGTIDYKAFYGKIPMSPEQGVADFFNTTALYAAPGVVDIGMDYTAGGQLFWNTPVTGLKAGYSYSFFDNLAAAGPFFAFPLASVNLQTDKYSYHTLSLEYIRDQWTFAAEWQRVGGDFNVINPFVTSISENRVVNWYVSVARRLGDKFEAGTYFSVQRNDNPSPTSPSAANHNHDWALSLRWDAQEHVTFKVEGHFIEGYYNVFQTARTPNPVIEDRSSYFAAKVTLSF